VATGEVNIVQFSDFILTFWCGDGKCHGIVTVSGIGVIGVLYSACLFIPKVPIPSRYIACGFIYKLNCGSSRADYAVALDLAIPRYRLDGEVSQVLTVCDFDIIFLYLSIVAFRPAHCQANCIVAWDFIGIFWILVGAIDHVIAVKIPLPGTDIAC